MAEAPSEQEVNRRRKVEALRAAGIEPYQSRYEKTHTCVEALALFTDLEKREGPQARTEPVSLAGRLVSIRVMGKATFAHIQDGTGRLQLHVKVDAVGAAAYQRFTELDLGDFIGALGPLFRTKRGEVTCEVHEFLLLAKALRPLPEKYHGLKDKELRYRQR
ncbi:MAG TPA: OB-fold nucleic acid binding domain-containing protein, partial [Candidatus Dormibacteraeota bacterium]|nr:OB-fold nucleic acid binding domain-containing protein [Candidatus Dormibacteraeota bacterium]